MRFDFGLFSAAAAAVVNRYKDAQVLCEAAYRQAAFRSDNLLLLGAVHFQLRNFSECILYNQVRTEHSEGIAWLVMHCVYCVIQQLGGEGWAVMVGRK